MSSPEVTDGEFWFLERHTPEAGLVLKVKEHILTRRSKFQLIEVFDTYEYGRVMTLDRLIMLTERDEAAYHEMLAHVALLSHENPRQILVVGGGDGGVLREVLKHPSVERVVQVEIDRDVVDVCREYFAWGEDTYSHPKVDLVIVDAIDYVADTKNSFDVVIVDSTDPVGPATPLFTEPFYRNVHKALTDGGLMTFQAGSPFYSSERIGVIVNMLRGFFEQAGLYVTYVPSYPSGVWGLGIASKHHNNFQNFDKVRYNTISDGLKYYNPDIHKGAFMLPEYIRQILETE